MITKEMINEKHPIPYDAVKRLEKNAYQRGRRAGQKTTVTRADVEQVLGRLTGLKIPMPPTSTFCFALAELGVKIEQ